MATESLLSGNDLSPQKVVIEPYLALHTCDYDEFAIGGNPKVGALLIRHAMLIPDGLDCVCDGWIHS